MINVHLASLIINFITFLFAYIFSTTLAGYFRAWVAAYMGDRTAEEEGFLSLDPFDHIDLMGIIVLFFFNFGWGKNIPIDPSNVRGKWRTMKLCAIFFSDALCHFVIAFVSLFLLIVLFDSNILQLVKHMLIYDDVSHLYIMHQYPNIGSVAISGAFIIFAFVFFNIVLSVLDFVVNGYRLVIFLWQESAEDGHWLYNDYAILLIHLLLIMLFVGPLKIFWINMITYLGVGLAHIFGFA